jgi:flavin reductase (DIM6/NTAB) family NADH-FMN oxidoreductase RutF
MNGEEILAFDKFIDGLDYPMFVVTAAAHGERSGCLVGFTTQTSMKPPRLLVCLSVMNRTAFVARDAGVLAVHLLGRDQHALAALFGGTTGDKVDKFAHCRWVPGPDDVPVLTDCPRRMVGQIVSRVPLGDHLGLLLSPLSIEATAGPVLTFQQVRDVAPGHPA